MRREDYDYLRPVARFISGPGVSMPLDLDE